MGDGRFSKHPGDEAPVGSTAGVSLSPRSTARVSHPHSGPRLWHGVTMWDSFLPDLIVAMFGAVLTVTIAVVSYFLKIRTDERRAIQSLIDELHRRRALRPGVAQLIPGAAGSDDYVRVTSSISSIRDEVRTTRDRVRQVEKLQRPLSEMTRACNRYLSLSAAMPDAYANHLVDLRQSLTSSIHELATSRHGVIALEPGAGTA